MLFTFIFSIGLPVNTVLAQPFIKIVVDPDVEVDYKRFLNGRSVQNIDYYGGPGSRRDVIEVVLFQQALILGGVYDAVNFQIEYSYRRALGLIAEGAVISSGALVWGEDASSAQYLMTEPIVRRDEFVVGFYTSPLNKMALSAVGLKDVQALRAVSNRQWRADWRTLQHLGIENVYDALTWEQMVKMVAANRADITMAPFQPTQGMYLMFSDIVLVPIKGIKVALDDTRHWVISKKHPHSQRVFQALKKGIRIMRREKRIVRAYTESGFFHPLTENWTLVNPK